ncbi:MAG: hypothetical protein IMY71_07015 [Bacteroidetes bacterium]|nr:hypothetical protein [Bacteroidota bacterium]
MKTKTKCCKLSMIIALFLTISYCAAQDKPDSLTYHIETNDGNTYMGQILAQDSVKILFNSDKLGEINILKTDIKKMHPLDMKKVKGDKYWFDNPQATRYFFSPNGYGLKKGEGYYQNVWVLVNSFAVGITDAFSIGGGLVPLFLFAGAPTPVWFTPKFSIPVSKDMVSLGAGALVGTVVGEENTGFGILYGISTFGSKDNNITVGLGYGYAGGEWAKSPMINLNAMFRTGARGYFLTENYFIQTGETTTVILSLGGRQIIKDAGLDYGLLIPIISEMDDFIAIPWLGITIPFGNMKDRKL